MRISLNRATAGGSLPLPEFIALAAKSGFQAADLDPQYGVDYGLAALQDLYAKHHITPGGWGPTEWRNDESQWKSDLPKLAARAKIARELDAVGGADSCASWIFPSSDQPFTETYNFHKTRLTETAKVLADHGLRLGLEFVAPYHLRVAKPHEFIFTPGLMLELANDIGPNVGLLVDCFHLHCAGIPADYVAKLPKDKIVLAHINDAPKVPTHEVQDFVRLLPGEGAINQHAFKEALQKTGYTGPVSVEVFGRLKDIPAPDAAILTTHACKSSGWL